MGKEDYKGWKVCELAMQGTCKECQDRDTFYKTCATGSFCDTYLMDARAREDLAAREILFSGETQ